MSNRLRNFFFIFGFAAILVMVVLFDITWSEVLMMLRRAGIWFPVILLLWLVIYIINAWAWTVIIRDRNNGSVSFLLIFKLTLTGFALNYTTPFGLMGGEPYRILELSPYVGKPKAVSSVILYVMMHIFSHFCLWLFAVVLYVLMHFIAPLNYHMNWLIAIALTCLAAVFVFVCYLFMRGYRYGMIVRLVGFLVKIPFLKTKIGPFVEKYQTKFALIDEQISELHGVRKRTFWGSLSMEFAARLLSCLEYWFIFAILMPGISYWDAVIIMAFSSLFSNIMFFLPMQLGSKEGGLAIAAQGLSIPGSYGLFTALVTRLREVVWTVLGLVLMKVGNTNNKRRSDD